jgi:hypothetical protein
VTFVFDFVRNLLQLLIIIIIIIYHHLSLAVPVIKAPCEAEAQGETLERASL